MKKLRIAYWSAVFSLLDRYAAHCWRKHELAKRIGGHCTMTHLAYIRAHRLSRKAWLRMSEAGK